MGALLPVITESGLAAVFNAQNTGLKAEITHMALGDHGRTPSSTETKLVNERMRVAIADGHRIDDHQIHLTALAEDGGQFWVHEIGFFLSDGTMLAVWSDSSPLAYKSNGVDVLLAFDLVLASLPADSVEVIGTDTELSLAAYADKFISNATASINAHAGVVKNAHWNMQLSEKFRSTER